MDRYEYHLHVWGGTLQRSGIVPHHFFPTAQERSDFIARLDQLYGQTYSRELSEGFHCRTATVLHRVVKYNGVFHHSSCDLGPNYPYDVAQYHLKWKWLVGSNDYPLGYSHNYDDDPPEIVAEWISGAFDQEILK